MTWLPQSVATWMHDRHRDKFCGVARRQPLHGIFSPRQSFQGPKLRGYLRRTTQSARPRPFAVCVGSFGRCCQRRALSCPRRTVVKLCGHPRRCRILTARNIGAGIWSVKPKQTGCASCDRESRRSLRLFAKTAESQTEVATSFACPRTEMYVEMYVCAFWKFCEC